MASAENRISDEIRLALSDTAEARLERKTDKRDRNAGGLPDVQRSRFICKENRRTGREAIRDTGELPAGHRPAVGKE